MNWLLMSTILLVSHPCKPSHPDLEIPHWIQAEVCQQGRGSHVTHIVFTGAMMRPALAIAYWKTKDGELRGDMSEYIGIMIFPIVSAAPTQKCFRIAGVKGCIGPLLMYKSEISGVYIRGQDRQEDKGIYPKLRVSI